MLPIFDASNTSLNALANCIDRLARPLAPRTFAEAMDTGCTNARPTGPRTGFVWDVVAAMYILNGFICDHGTNASTDHGANCDHTPPSNGSFLSPRSRTAIILAEMRQDNAIAILTEAGEMASRQNIRIAEAERAIEAGKTIIYGSATGDNGTDRIPAERRTLTVQSSQLTGIPLLDGIALLPDTAGSLTTLPEKLPRTVVSSFLSAVDWSYRGLDFEPPTLSDTLRRVNPSTNHGGGRPRKVHTSTDAVYVATLPSPRTAHGSFLHAAFRSTDEETRSLHGNGRQTEMSDYHALRVQVATRRAHNATQKLASADW